jgi:hypothetical protein
VRDLHVRLLALGLAAFGLFMTSYKVERLGLPLTPGDAMPMWTVEARLSFQANGNSVKAALTIPKDPPGFVVIDEDFISSSFGMATENEGANRRARWAVRRASGRQTLYYRVSLVEDRQAGVDRAGPTPKYPPKPEYPEPEGAAIEALLEEVRADSADIESFTRELLIRLNNDVTDENIKLLRKVAPTDAEWAGEIAMILSGARIPTRIAWGLHLREGMGATGLEPMLEVHNGQRWIAFDLRSGTAGFPEDFLVWQTGGSDFVELVRGSRAEVEFSATRRVRDFITVAEKRARLIGSRIMDFSLFSLPVAIQNVYQVLLTIPLGVALIVVLRNVIGLKSFGTFMPVLIALAFRETHLAWGVALMVTVVSIGLLIRFYLENLKLLLVPRLASVVIIVILLMVAISILSHRLGLDQGLSISLFPMVILAMTIERMSIQWEESGPREAVQQLAGSIAAACAAYLVMSNAQLQYMVFVFPELLLVLLACTLLLGRYKGYRLFELWRFRAAILNKKD